MAKPSRPQIRARQRRLLEYMGTTGKSYKQAAKDFGVTPQQLRQFTSPKLRKSDLSRSSSYQKLYKSADRGGKPANKVVGVKVQRFQYTERQLQVFRTTPGFPPDEVERRVRVGRLIGDLYGGKTRPETEWAVFAQNKNVPPSLAGMRLLYRNNQISSSRLTSALRAWRQIYNINDRQYNQTLDNFGVVDDELGG